MAALNSERAAAIEYPRAGGGSRSHGRGEWILWRWVVPASAVALVAVFAGDLMFSPEVATGFRSAARPVVCVGALALSVVVAGAALRRRFDVTARQAARERLLESEGRFCALADSMPLPVWMSDPDGRFTYFNRAFLGFTGRTLEEQLKEGFLTGVHETERSAVEKALRNRTSEGNGAIEFEHRHRHADGGYRWLLTSASPRRGPDGVFAGYMGSCVDITERRRTEQALALSERRYRAIVESQAELICRWTPEGILTFVNEAYCRCFGRTREELVGQSFVPLLHEDDRPVVEVAVARLLGGEERICVDERVYVADGSLRWQRWSARRIDQSSAAADDRHPIEFQSVGWDVTELKQAEERLKQSLRAHEEQARRERMLRRELDHRVRNNLTGLLGLLRLYERTSDPPHPRRVLRQLEWKLLAMREVHEMIGGTDGEGVELAGLCRRLVDLCCPATHVDRVRIGESATSERGASISSEHAAALAMIVQELLTNSLKHGVLAGATPEDAGEVRIDWSARTGEGGGRPGFTLRWRETGPGSPRPGPEGTGIGLIRGFAASDLQGTCRFDFDERGLSFELEAGTPLRIPSADVLSRA